MFQPEILHIRIDSINGIDVSFSFTSRTTNEKVICILHIDILHFDRVFIQKKN